MRTIIYDRLRVLVVDDESFTRNLVLRMLRELGVVHVGTKATGKDGLMELLRTRPDIVFCDVHMQPMNGRQFLEGLRTIKVKGVDATPLVFITADASPETVQFARDLDADGYLIKPVTLKQSRERIDAIVLQKPELFSHIVAT